MASGEILIMDTVQILIGASASVPERIIRRHLSAFPVSGTEKVSYVDGNPTLHKVVQEIWPGSVAVSANSPITARKVISKISHLVLIWDGEDLSNVLFEARLQKKKTKLIAVQVTRVVNKKTTNNYDIYIGRGTPWGNPFAISHGDGPDRAEVIEKYREFFYKKIDEDKSFKNGILSMRGLRLACFCKPQACHGDVIAEYLDSLPESPDGEGSD